MDFILSWSLGADRAAPAADERLPGDPGEDEEDVRRWETHQDQPERSVTPPPPLCGVVNCHLFYSQLVYYPFRLKPQPR